MFTPGNTETDPLDAAANALKTGNVKKARHILRGVIAKDPVNVAVREMVYQVSSNDNERVFSLDHILKLALAIELRCKNSPVCRQI
jgi:hypothetical protein